MLHAIALDLGLEFVVSARQGGFRFDDGSILNRYGVMLNKPSHDLKCGTFLEKRLKVTTAVIQYLHKLHVGSSVCLFTINISKGKVTVKTSDEVMTYSLILYIDSLIAQVNRNNKGK